MTLVRTHERLSPCPWSLSTHRLLSERISRSLGNNARLCLTFRPAFTATSEDSLSMAADEPAAVSERPYLTRAPSLRLSHFVSPIPRPFRNIGPQFLLVREEGADVPVRAAKYHAGSWPRQSTAMQAKKKKRRRARLPLFACTRRRPRIGGRKQRGKASARVERDFAPRAWEIKPRAAR